MPRQIRGPGECVVQTTQLLNAARSWVVHVGNGFRDLDANTPQPSCMMSALLYQILASPAGAPVTPAQMEGLKDIFRLFTHQSGVDFMSRVTAFPQRIPSALMHIMAWACRVRVSSPNIHRIMTKASSSHMLTGRHLSRLKVPAMLIWGRHERIFPRDSLEFFRRHLPKDVEINEEEDFGHVPFLDDPDRLVEIVHEFMVRTCPREPTRAA